MNTSSSKALFDKVSIKCSQLTSFTYSTSFSIGIRCLHKELRNPIYSIYGFVRLADEIVDSFHDYDKETLLNRFEADTYLAIEEHISLNPILNSFQNTVSEYKIENYLIEMFLKSMRMDLSKKSYSNQSIGDYILGSAEVVGLMCLRIFCKGDSQQYEQLKPYAMKLGAAFQKVNFLRDLNEDYQVLGRNYFPNINFNNFNEESKQHIESDIEDDFRKGFEGIKMLPNQARLGVYVAYIYYRSLLKKIQSLPSQQIMNSRIRVSNSHKFSLLIYSFVKQRFNLI